MISPLFFFGKNQRVPLEVDGSRPYFGGYRNKMTGAMWGCSAMKGPWVPFCCLGYFCRVVKGGVQVQGEGCSLIFPKVP